MAEATCTVRAAVPDVWRGVWSQAQRLGEVVENDPAEHALRVRLPRTPERPTWSLEITLRAAEGGGTDIRVRAGSRWLRLISPGSANQADSLVAETCEALASPFQNRVGAAPREG